ncbi:hypothetical protein RDI61_17985 [Pseudomonas plecoglossicida]|uniref:hypothetical protein n=1 Tax=Pseudomonas putida group TaxID=136845 RepID=UPI0024108BC3|nr:MULTISPECIES: hypothetical protein [Pseudomonas]MDQ7965919.1 hypothetical protein [Pseudomonas plecoglossicida]WFG01079.1 hypothetical protein P3X84_18315 [Pseudomonas putida]
MSKVSPSFEFVSGQGSYCGYDLELQPAPVLTRNRLGGAYAYVGYSGLGLSQDGRDAVTWGKVFFDNVFVTPAVIDAGQISSDETFEFVVWHSYRSSIALSGVSEFGVEGVDLIGQKSGALLSFEASSYEVFLSQRSTDVDYRVSFDFGAVGSYDFSLSASRAIVLNFGIDWSVQPELKHSYLTEVIESYDGTEQRISLRDKPRMSVTYQYGLTDAEQYQFGNLVGNFSGKYLVPLWPFQTNLSMPLMAGQSSVAVNSINSYIRSSSKVMIVDEDVWETLDVAGASELLISFKTLAKKNYSSAARLVPIEQALIGEETSSIVHGMNVEITTATFDFDEVEYSKPIACDDFALFNGRRVLDIRPDRSQDVSIRYLKLRETFDPNIGQRYSYDRQQGAVKFFQFGWRFFNEFDRMRFEDFAEFERGGQGEFYVESPLIALELNKDVEAPTLQIVVKKANYKNFLRSKAFAPAIAIKLYNGTRLYRNVVGAADGLADTEVIDLGEPVSGIEMADVEYIAPLFLGRFESDEFNYVFDTPVDSTITKIIRQLLNADPEIDREITVT